MSEKVTFLTWNYNKIKSTFKNEAFKEIVLENDIDIIILQESYNYNIKLLIQNHEEIIYDISRGGNQKFEGVRVFLKKNKFDYTNTLKNQRNKLVMLTLKLKTGNEWINIAAAHFHSKVQRTERTQMWKSKKIIDEINNFENTISLNNNTVLIGDFNHNPFEINMQDPNLLNSRNNRILLTNHRNLSKSSIKENFWYNPMWNFLGDHDFVSNKERVSGTYFRYNRDETPIWNLFDGFIVRPYFMNRIDFSNSSIIEKTKNKKFTKQITISDSESMIKTEFSDHLPFKFTIKLN